jgi:dihydropteroate synthase
MTKLAAILNFAPDSFSADGVSPGEALARCASLIANGADAVEVGAESTRPGAVPLTAREERERLEGCLAEVAALCREKGVECGVDTYHAETAEYAVACGADYINDVSGGADPALPDVLAASPAHVRYVVMHNLGVPADKKNVLPPDSDPVAEISRWLEERLRRIEAAGISKERLLFDPGIGFGKTASQSAALLRELYRFRRFGLPLYVGHSRKSFLRELAGASEHASERDAETLALSVALMLAGTEYLRVHDVASHAKARRTLRATFG